MDVANKENGIVVGTGDLSELALGWATYNGDHMSMYAVNASIPKTLVRYLVGWAAENHFESDVAVAAGRGAVGACGGIVGAAGDESACGGVEDRGTLPETSREDVAGRKRSVREILMDIIDTPVSPELKPADSEGNITQKTCRSIRAARLLPLPHFPFRREAIEGLLPGSQGFRGRI